MSDLDSGGRLELAIGPRNDQYDVDDDRWRDQVATLYAELQAVADTVRRGSAVEGTKGATEQVIVALGSVGAFAAVVECFRAWLGRDRSRRIEVRWDEDGVERFVTLSGDGLDAESVREVARAAAQRLGGSSWAEGTERS